MKEKTGNSDAESETAFYYYFIVLNMFILSSYKIIFSFLLFKQSRKHDLPVWQKQDQQVNHTFYFCLKQNKRTFYCESLVLSTSGCSFLELTSQVDVKNRMRDKLD